MIDEEKTMTDDETPTPIPFTLALEILRGDRGGLTLAERLELLAEGMLANIELISALVSGEAAEEVRSLGMFLRSTPPVGTVIATPYNADGTLDTSRAVKVGTAAEVTFTGRDAEKLAAMHGHVTPLVHDEILDTAQNIINGDRRDDYGSARQSFETIAALWAPILGREVTAVEVSLCMIGLKVARALAGPEKRDSWIDMCGYAALGGELADEDHKNRARAAVNKTTEENDEC